MTLDLIGIAEESTVRVEPDRPMSSDEFFDFCQANSFFRIERMADGEIVIMPPAGDESSHECARMNARLFNWAERDGRGRVFDSSAGFKIAERRNVVARCLVDQPCATRHCHPRTDPKVCADMS